MPVFIGIAVGAVHGIVVGVGWDHVQAVGGTGAGVGPMARVRSVQGGASEDMSWMTCADHGSRNHCWLYDRHMMTVRMRSHLRALNIRSRKERNTNE